MYKVAHYIGSMLLPKNTYAIFYGKKWVGIIKKPDLWDGLMVFF